MLQQHKPAKSHNYQCYSLPMGCRLIDERFPKVALVYHTLVELTLSGMQIHTNQLLDIHQPLYWKLLLPDGSIIHCKTHIVWIERLPYWASPTYDIQLQFLALATEDLQRLARLLQISPTLIDLCDDRRQSLSTPV